MVLGFSLGTTLKFYVQISNGSRSKVLDGTLVQEMVWIIGLAHWGMWLTPENSKVGFCAWKAAGEELEVYWIKWMVATPKGMEMGEGKRLK